MNISGLGSSSYSYSLQTRSVSQTGQSEMAKKMAGRMMEEMDSDGDGSLSADEIGVEQSVLSQADSDGDSKLSDSELIALMGQMAPPPPPPGGMGMSQAGQEGGAGQAPPDASELFSQLDTDGDGSISQEEFLAGRPDDVSEEQAAQMWSRLDSSGAGSLSQEDFVSAMEAQGPPPGPPPGAGGQGMAQASGSSTLAESLTGTTSDSGNSLSELLASLLANYGLSRYQESQNSGLAGLLSGSQSGGSISLTA
ncbi:MAG: EF-hand domain-containing protein [Desulfarculus sp.]|nr:EF-hand domain-containing protein [Desulfarculus sp.]